MAGSLMADEFEIFRNEFRPVHVVTWRIRLLVRTLCVRRLFSYKELDSSNITGFVTQK